MISKITLLILGAGASQPYGYPLQAGLKSEILGRLDDKEKRRELIEWHGYSDFLVDNFYTSFQQSGKDNVEEFLAERSEFEEIGKLVLLECIREKESMEVLFKDEEWYSYLYDAMNDSLEDFGKNNLSIITFNFDRSLEAFLFQALRNSYGKREEEVARVLSNIRIFHMHGVVGSLPWQTSPAVSEYGQKLSQEQLALAAKAMKLSNDIDASSLLKEAEVIAFLGFGYNDRDMKTLGISELEGKTIIGSTFGLKPGEIKAIAKRNNEKISFPKTKIAQVLDTKGFLRESGVLGL